MALTELDLVALRADLPALGLETGDIGTIVLVHDEGKAYEVEFVAADGRTIAVETLGPEVIEPLSGQQILHVRKLAIA
jgi:hypothetical protein